jgi:hypothetical protein
MNWEEWFEYRKGELYWKKVVQHSRIKVGTIAGNYDSSGYRQVQFKGKKYMVHRIIWEMLKNKIPDNYTIDHINLNKSDNHIENLRLATHAENCRNRKLRSDSTSQFKGVSWNKKANKYQSSITLDGTQNHLGYFNTPEEASQAYQKAAKKLHGEFTCITS